MNTNAKPTADGVARMDRRDLLKSLGLTGAAFVLGTSGSNAANVLGTLVSPDALPATVELTPFVVISNTTDGRPGTITIMNPRPDIGQGTFQSVPALIAEELGMTLDQVTIKQTGGEKAYGRGQCAGGSSSIRTGYLPMRKVGASAREMLVQAAANTWNVPAGECSVANARVHHKASGKSLGYGELAEAAAKLPVPGEPKLKDPKDFMMLGKDAKRPDVPGKSSGKTLFGIDMKVPGMLYASVEHGTVIGSKLVDFDDTKAKQTKGVRQVVKAERVLESRRFDCVAVVADTYWAALQGRKALQVRWDH